MNKPAYIYTNYDNWVVLNVYLSVIKEGLEQAGYKCAYIKSLEYVKKDDLIVFSTAKDVFLNWFKGYHNIILWQQGIAGEESYMRNHSVTRKAVLNFIDCFAMKKAKIIFFVSDYMKQYYEKMAHADFSGKCYIMPCFNERLDEDMISKKDYSKKTFTYVGSLSVWQCFEETVELYSKIENSMENTSFKVLTFNVDEAVKILKEKNVKNYTVKCVPQERVREELADVSFGFILRKDVEVNRVATPTKISSYLAAGVLPIYSACLRDFHRQALGKSFACSVDCCNDIKRVSDFVNNNADKTLIDSEIHTLFQSYYSEEYHSKKISALCRKLL